MHTIGLLGGVASGKSLVAGYLAEMGAGVLDADRVGHEVLCSAEVKRAALRRWGEKILGRNGEIDRSKLARIVFGDSPACRRERKYLEELTHPEIRRRLARQAKSMARAGKPAAILDAPLLLEAGWDKLCETLVFVEAPREQRLARAAARGWTHDDVAARERSQWPLERKRRRADAIIDNSASPSETRLQTERFWRRLMGESGDRGDFDQRHPP